MGQRVIMLNTALYAETVHKQTLDEETAGLIADFNSGEKKLIIIDDEDATKDIHYAIVKEN